MKGSVAFAMGVFMLGSTGALAAPEEGDGGQKELPGFKEADKNGDQSLTFKEVKDLGVSKDKFKEEDLDNDGKLSKYDYKYGIK